MPRKTLARTLIASCSLALYGCSSDKPQSLVTAPTDVKPQYSHVNMEGNPGAIYQPSHAVLLYEEQTATNIGDTLRINIAENLSSSNTANTTTSQSSTLNETGPGAMSSMGGLIAEIFNYSGKGSASKGLEGKGNVTNSNTISGSLIVTVVSILPNNYLEVAGEKKIAASGTTTTLRLSGMVNRHDIKAGNQVSADNVADIRIEQVVDGVASQVTTRSGIQNTLSGLIDFW